MPISTSLLYRGFPRSPHATLESRTRMTVSRYAAHTPEVTEASDQWEHPPRGRQAVIRRGCKQITTRIVVRIWTIRRHRPVLRIRV